MDTTRREKKIKLPVIKFIIKKILIVFIVCVLAFVLATIIINAGMILAARNYVYTDIAEIPPRRAVLVLGSQSIGTRLSPVLEDRVVAGIMLMENNIGQKLILSGDHGQPYYDEVTAMHLYVTANAPFIQEEDIFLDYAGFNTWDSMYRARDVFEVEDLIIVTQGFHISRAVCMARSLGMNAVGYSLNQDRYRGQSLRSWQFREYFARTKAFFSIIFRPEPRYLGEKIPITGDGRNSWNGNIKR